MQVPVPPILESKKFLASALASVIAFGGVRSGMQYEEIAFVIGPLLTFVGFQGLADIGKSKAVVEAEAKKEASA